MEIQAANLLPYRTAAGFFISTIIQNFLVKLPRLPVVFPVPLGPAVLVILLLTVVGATGARAARKLAVVKGHKLVTAIILSPHTEERIVLVHRLKLAPRLPVLLVPSLLLLVLFPEALPPVTHQWLGLPRILLPGTQKLQEIIQMALIFLTAHPATLTIPFSTEQALSSSIIISTVLLLFLIPQT